MSIHKILTKTLNEKEYSFEHVPCRCFSHCNDDLFTVDGKNFYVNESNADLCDLTELIFKDEIYKIVEISNKRYHIFVNEEDVADDFHYTLFRSYNKKNYVFDNPKDWWEIIDQGHVETENVWWPIMCDEYGDFLAEYCELNKER